MLAKFWHGESNFLSICASGRAKMCCMSWCMFAHAVNLKLTKCYMSAMILLPFLNKNDILNCIFCARPSLTTLLPINKLHSFRCCSVLRVLPIKHICHIKTNNSLYFMNYEKSIFTKPHLPNGSLRIYSNIATMYIL